MIRAFFKDLLKEIYDEKINTITFDYIDKKVGDTIDSEIKNALKPAVDKIRSLEKDLDKQIQSISKEVKQDVASIKQVSNEALAGLTDKIPAAIEQFEVNISDLETDFNERVRGVVENEINKTSYNVIVQPVKDQFADFVNDFDFMASMKDRQKSEG